MQHPVLFDDGSGWLATRQLAKVRRAQANAGLAVYRHGLQARVQSEPPA